MLAKLRKVSRATWVASVATAVFVAGLAVVDYWTDVDPRFEANRQAAAQRRLDRERADCIRMLQHQASLVPARAKSPRVSDAGLTCDRHSPVREDVNWISIAIVVLAVGAILARVASSLFRRRAA